jgi:SAM-dependent methyltransferase
VTAGPVAGDFADRLAFLNDAVAATAALTTANRLGVFAALDGEPADTAGLAAACGISERGAARLLAALAGLGLVEPDGGRWRAAVPGLTRLDGLLDLWTRLPETVRHDEPAVPADTPNGAATLYPKAAGFLGAMLSRAAERAAAHLVPYPPADPVSQPVADPLAQPSAGRRVLDAGAGAAPWGLAVAARDPGCTVTALDLPEVLAVTRHAVTAAGRSEQFGYQAADLFTADLGWRSYDLVIAGNLCHLFDEPTSGRLVARLARCLRPGGALAVMDVLPDVLADPVPLALYDLGLLLRTSGGGVHRLAAYQAWLAEAGLGPAECHPLLDRFPLVLLVARAPAAGGPR